MKGNASLNGVCLYLAEAWPWLMALRHNAEHSRQVKQGIMSWQAGTEG